MPVPCNLIKPYMFILSVDEHDAILAGALPPAPMPVPALFKDVLWASLNAVYWPSCDDPSPNVNGDGHALYKREHEVEHWRVHVLLPVSPAATRIPPVLPPFIPPAVTDLGLIALHIYRGTSKCRFGPFSVKANITAPGDPVGVINIPYSPIGLLNSESCGALALGMAIIDVASPNSVVAGMSLGDYLGCLTLIAIDRFADWLKERFDGLPPWLKDFVVDPLIDALGEAIGEAVSQFMVPAINIAVGRYTSGPLGEMLGPAAPQSLPSVTDGVAAITNAFVDGLIDAETEAIKDMIPVPLPRSVERAIEAPGRALKSRTQQRINDFFGVEGDA